MVREKRILEKFLSGLPGPQPMEHEAKKLLSGLGLQTPEGVFIKKPEGKRPFLFPSKEEVLLKTGRMGFPLAAKAVSPAVRSKSGAGAIRLDLATGRQSFEAVRELMGMQGARGVLVEKMIKGGMETIVGGMIDAQFGPVVMFGLGGIFTEVFRDVSFALAPATQAEALRLVSRIKGQGLLQAFFAFSRGQRRPVAGLKELAGAIVTVSRLMATGLVKEIDLNPVALFPHGAFVLDAKIFVQDLP